ncbi:hypothetical protein BO94DRAFT_609942 [Aspergillus sclerotioniger CBS 115572]|uniref:Uncharacterized protein n=1 Tax=Aspergillus sclerotioniger CBS 115572 TaxID=1450535 RepID=A0A317X7H5_9EURO|nr:hypothetical protein BO94DRAFT_609942 [Aspergillus sclerotioniger CBS 115572]PWY94554.1 hypothetical protein BO94DRAFT_609942 [Aspergillus sclerotioniger CBS 115572]
MSTPTPVILCGAMREVAALIRTLLLPEYNVVYAGHNLSAAEREVPLILSGSPPPPSKLHTQIGSNDFTDPPRAVITGGGYNEERFQALYQACTAAKNGVPPVPFFRTDNGLTDRLAATGEGPAHASAEYPAAVTRRLKEKLREAGVGEGEGRGGCFGFEGGGVCI